MIAGMESNKTLSPKITELFLKEEDLIFHLFLYYKFILKCLKL